MHRSPHFWLLVGLVSVLLMAGDFYWEFFAPQTHTPITSVTPSPIPVDRNPTTRPVTAVAVVAPPKASEIAVPVIPTPQQAHVFRVFQTGTQNFVAFIAKTDDWVDTGVPIVVSQRLTISHRGTNHPRFAVKVGSTEYAPTLRTIDQPGAGPKEFYTLVADTLHPSKGGSFSSNFIDTVRIHLIDSEASAPVVWNPEHNFDAPTLAIWLVVRDLPEMPCTFAPPGPCAGYESERLQAKEEAQRLVDKLPVDERQGK